MPTHTFVIVEGRVTPPKRMNFRTLKEGFLSMKLKRTKNPKLRGGAKAVWSFSENSSVLVAPVPDAGVEQRIDKKII